MTSSASVPPALTNLDAVYPDTLRAIVDAVQANPRRVAVAWFPSRPKGYVSATKSLMAYASNKEAAMQCRSRGDIGMAVMYENICDGIYRRLQDFARVW